MDEKLKRDPVYSINNRNGAIMPERILLFDFGIYINFSIAELIQMSSS
jgi:hypothetical protein